MLRVLLISALLGATLHAQTVTWHDSLEAGLQEAGTLGRAVLLVTAWKDGV